MRRSAPTDPAGAWSIPGVVATGVVAVVEPPAGSAAPPTEVPVDLSAGDVVGVVLALPVAAVVVPPTTPPPTTPPTSTPPPTTPTPRATPTLPAPSPGGVGRGAGPQLAATGTPVDLLAVGGGLLLVADDLLVTDRRALARVFWTVLAVLVAASVLAELGRATTGANVLVPTNDPGTGMRVVRFFSYFTIQSNILLFASVLPLTRDPGHDGRGWRVLRLAALMGITVTGLVYVFVLGPTLDPTGLGWWTNAGLHYAAPLLAVVGWLVLGPRPRVTGHTVGWSMAWPVGWIGYALALGALTDWYPYPFMDVTEIGYPTALGNLAFVAVLAVALLLLFRLVDRKLPATAPEVSPARR